MKPLYPLLCCLIFVQTLVAQNWQYHPVLTLLGTDLHEMGETSTGLIGYDGLGKHTQLRTANYLGNRQIDFSWVPNQSLPNGFGLLALPTYQRGLLLSTGPGNLHAQAGHDFNWKRINQSIQVQAGQQKQRLDDNQDGFLDQEQFQQFIVRHQLTTYARGWRLMTDFNFLDRQNCGGQLDYHWPEDQGSDRIYGYGSDTRQWLGNLQIDKQITDQHHLHFRLNARDHRETGWYGQRQLHNQERRGGGVAAYTYQQKTHETQVLAHYQLQDITQHWNSWQSDQSVSQLKLGMAHQRFFGEKWLARAGLQMDRHTDLGWQPLPNLRLDYLGWKKIRVGLLGGRDYRYARLLEEQRPYLLSQRQWKVESYGADQAWYAGISGKTAAYRIGEAQQQFKLLYLSRFYETKLLADPSAAEEVAFYLQSDKLPLQHLLMGTLITSYRSWNWSLVYRFRHQMTPLRSGQNLQLFDARHGLFSSLSYQRRHGKNDAHHWQVRNDYLLRSPLDLPDGSSSPVLHDVRLHAEASWRLQRGYRHQLAGFAGIANLFNQTQQVLYQQADLPFTQGFDGSAIWGNPQGRQWYAGVRWQW